MFGFDIAIISGANTSLQAYFNLNELELGWGTALLVLGAMFGALGSGGLTDRFGRKKGPDLRGLAFCPLEYGKCSLSDLCQFCPEQDPGWDSPSERHPCARPCMWLKCLPRRSEARSSLSINLRSSSGESPISYLINYGLYGVENDWRWMFATGVVPSVLFFLGLFAIPESPRWLYLKGHKEESRTIICRIAGAADADLEIEEIAKTLDAQKSTTKLKELPLSVNTKSRVRRISHRRSCTIGRDECGRQLCSEDLSGGWL